MTDNELLTRALTAEQACRDAQIQLTHAHRRIRELELQLATHRADAIDRDIFHHEMLRKIEG